MRQDADPKWAPPDLRKSAWPGLLPTLLVGLPVLALLGLLLALVIVLAFIAHRLHVTNQQLERIVTGLERLDRKL
jgi:hypothetical protein